jgi:hypothetical protein
MEKILLRQLDPAGEKVPQQSSICGTGDNRPPTTRFQSIIAWETCRALSQATLVAGLPYREHPLDGSPPSGQSPRREQSCEAQWSGAPVLPPSVVKSARTSHEDTAARLSSNASRVRAHPAHGRGGTDCRQQRETDR